jgi:hypothetical protein
MHTGLMASQDLTASLTDIKDAAMGILGREHPTSFAQADHALSTLKVSVVQMSVEEV